MKKKEEEKHLDKEWELLDNYFIAFLTTGDQEALHKFRVQIKKIKALVTLIDGSNSESKLMDIFKPLKKIFRTAGVIRDAHINLQLGARYNFKNEVFEAHQQLIIEQGVNDFLGKGKKFGKILKSVYKDLKKQISNVGDKLIAAYYKKQLEQIDVNFTVSGFNEDMHTNRKLIKILIYNYKLASKPLSNELQIDIGYLDELQEALGQWHDNVVAAELFSSPELNDKVIVKQINKINGSVKRKIKQLSKDFLIKAKGKPQENPTNAV